MCLCLYRLERLEKIPIFEPSLFLEALGFLPLSLSLSLSYSLPELSNILCLDSSSDKVVVQLEVLNRIELMTGRKITDLFEYVVGSGIGGLLILAMVYGKG